MTNDTERRVSIDDFIQSRPELSTERKTMLRYLASVSDNAWIEERTKGRSILKCEFDCGAYKGSEILTYQVSKLCPFRIADGLMSLTSGHHFSFEHGKQALLDKMGGKKAALEQAGSREVEVGLDSLDFEAGTATFTVPTNIRWTAGKYYIAKTLRNQAATERMQAHLDAALADVTEDELNAVCREREISVHDARPAIAAFLQLRREKVRV